MSAGSTTWDGSSSPKEIRRTMRIREGDPLEIYTENDGEVIFKKYSPIGELSPFAAQYAEVLYHAAGVPVLICDRDHCVASAGIPKKEALDPPGQHPARGDHGVPPHPRDQGRRPAPVSGSGRSGPAAAVAIPIIAAAT